MKNKIISILCIFILISFCFISDTFAACIDTKYDYLYSYNIISNDNITNQVGKILKDDRVISGDYYYFCYYNTGNYCYMTVLVPKNLVTTDNLKILDFYQSTEKCQAFGLYLSDSNICNSIIRIAGSSGYDGSNGTNLWVGGYYKSANKCFEIPFATNYDKDINYICSNGETKVFFTAPILEPEVIYPAIQNTAEDLSTGTFEYIGVHPGSFSNTENIGLNIYDITDLEDEEDVYSKTPLFSTTLTSSSSYYKSFTLDNVTEFWYEIPRSSLNINYKNDKTYLYSLLLDGSPIQEVQATVGGLTEEDILNNSLGNLQGSIVEGNKELQETITESNKELQSSIDKQTEAIEENNKTNKNIFEKIGEILSYLNPFSENFFAYKLVELIVEGLKSLFVPGEDFFSTYFDELNEWFSDRLGFLYYPLELLFDLLDRFLNIDFAEPIINIPDIKEPFTNVTLIKSISFNFNDLLSNETLKNVHDIYFIIVDAVIYIGLVTLLYRKYEEVMTK